MPRGDFAPSPWFNFSGNFKPYPPTSKKEDYCSASGLGTMTKPDEMFGAERIEWCDTIEPIVPSIIKELEEEEKEMVSNP